MTTATTTVSVRLVSVAFTLQTMVHIKVMAILSRVHLIQMAVQLLAYPCLDLPQTGSKFNFPYAKHSKQIAHPHDAAKPLILKMLNLNLKST